MIDIEALKKELLMSKMTHNFTFSRDEVMQLLGGHVKVLGSLSKLAPLTNEDKATLLHIDAALGELDDALGRLSESSMARLVEWTQDHPNGGGGGFDTTQLVSMAREEFDAFMQAYRES